MRRTTNSFGHFLGWFSVLATIAILALVDFGPTLTDTVVDTLYANVERPNAGEVPPTFTHFPSGPRIASVLGGKGEGLNCSIPEIAKLAFGKPKDAQSPLAMRFRQACIMHDLCYRHGLATYGYTQTDCDYMLQEQAYQACSYFKTDRAGCKLAAKKVLLGVRFGGKDSYQAAESSTYFEYDPFPLRATEFSFARSLYSQLSGKESLIAFHAKQSSLSATEFNGEPQNVWLPPQYYAAAPQHTLDEKGFSRLVWPLRRDSVSTAMCITQRSHATLYREPSKANGLASCNMPAVQSLVDLNSGSPVVVRSPKNKVIAAAVTNLGHSEEINIDGATVDTQQLNAKWIELGANNPYNVYGFFQSAYSTGNFLDTGAAHDLLLFKRGRRKGVGYEDSVDFIIVPQAELNPDLEPEAEPGTRLTKRAAVIIPKQPIPEAAEPVVRLPNFSGRDSLLGLGLAGCRRNFDCAVESVWQMLGWQKSPACNEKGICFRLYGFGNEPPLQLPIEIAGKYLGTIDPSFAARPILVVGHQQEKKVQLFLSRVRHATGECKSNSAKDTTCVDHIHFEIAALTVTGESGDRALSYDGGALCKLQKVLKKNAPGSCQLPTIEETHKKFTWANRMKASQMLVGDFVGNADLDVAFMDVCDPANPVVLEGRRDASGNTTTFASSRESALELQCEAFDTSRLALAKP
ncbi:MAG: hypothetical protein HC855_12555 [Rhizobiales bacterium]|nr:hypothetical protein [Hyphomicrobiales bacterium]